MNNIRTFLIGIALAGSVSSAHASKDTLPTDPLKRIRALEDRLARLESVTTRPESRTGSAASGSTSKAHPAQKSHSDSDTGGAAAGGAFGAAEHPHRPAYLDASARYRAQRALTPANRGAGPSPLGRAHSGPRSDSGAPTHSASAPAASAPSELSDTHQPDPRD